MNQSSVLKIGGEEEEMVMNNNVYCNNVVVEIDIYKCIVIGHLEIILKIANMDS